MAMRKITISNTDFIGPLGVYGPVITPTFYDEKLVYALVQRQYKVTEISTDNKTYGKKIRLSITNFNDPKRFYDKDTKLNNISAVIGNAAVGKASVVQPLAPSAPVTNIPIPPSEGNATTKTTKEVPPVAVPINMNGLSKSQRKKLAKEAAAKKKAEEEKVTETVTEPETTETTTEETDETTSDNIIILK